MPNEVSWGPTTGTFVAFKGKRVPTNTMEQGLPRLSTGAEIERAAQVGQTKIRFNSYHNGLTRKTGIQPWASAQSEYTENQGIQTRLEGLAILPEALTTQAALAAVDISTAVSTNCRVHAANCSLGTTGLRYYIVVDKRIYRDTSLTDPALVAPTSNTFTDTITCIEEVVFNNTPYLAVAGAGTDNIKGLADPTIADYVAGYTTLVNLDPGDRIDAMRYFPTLGPGIGIAVGKYNGVTGVWFWKGSDSIPATLSPVVLSSTKDQKSATNAIQDTGFVLFGAVTELGTNNPWTNPTNVLADDGVYATNAAAAALAPLHLTQAQWSALLPSGGAELTGITATVEGKESNADDNFRDFDVYLTADWSGGSVTGATATAGTLALFGSGQANGTEFGTVDTTITYGSSTSTWGAELSLADVLNPTFGLFYQATTTGGATVTASIDVFKIKAHYRPYGTSIAFPLGGWSPEKSQAFPTRLVLIAPERDQEGAITVPRKTWYLDFDYEADQKRPVMEITSPATNMRYIHDVEPYQGGFAITGGNKAGPGKYVRFLDSQGQVKNFDMPLKNGSSEWRCNAMFTQGSWLICDMVTSDYTNRQWWYFNNAKWFCDTLQQSETTSAASIALQPIPWAEKATGLQQSQIYSVFPRTTNTAVVRQFLPEDLSADPRLTDTSQVKSMGWSSTTEDTGLYLIGTEKDWGPEEANKTITTADFQGRGTSASSTVKSDISIDGGTTYNSSLSKTFTSAFEHFDVLGSGVAYETIKEKLTLAHTAGNAATPNGAGVLWTSIQQWPSQDVIEFEVDEDSIDPDIHTFRSRLYSLQDTKNVQPLVYADLTIPAVLEGVYFAPKVPQRGQAMQLTDLTPPLNNKGVPEDKKLRIRFRKVPGVA